MEVNPAAIAVAALLIAGLLPNTPVAADVLHLKDGDAVRGRITQEQDVVSVEGSLGRVTYPRNRVDRIAIEASPWDEYARRRAALLPVYSADGENAPTNTSTAGDWTALGDWCRESGLDPEAREAYETAVRRDADHEPARRALGHHRWDGRWVTEEEFHAAAGEIRFRGKWMPREEMEAILDSERASREAKALLERIELARREEQAVERRAVESRRRTEEEAARRREERIRRETEEEALRVALAEQHRRRRDDAVRSRFFSENHTTLGGGVTVWGWPATQPVVVLQPSAAPCPPRPVCRDVAERVPVTTCRTPAIPSVPCGGRILPFISGSHMFGGSVVVPNGPGIPASAPCRPVPACEAGGATIRWIVRR